MIVTVDQAQLADLAAAEAVKHPLRTPARRAAAALVTALATTDTVDAARRALPTFTTPETAEAAIELLHRLASTKGTP